MAHLSQRQPIRIDRALASSPERRQAELEQAASDAAKQRRFRQMLRDDPEAWAKEYPKRS